MIGSLSAPVTPAQMVFAPGLLTAQVCVQITTGGFVRIHMQVNALVADRYLAFNLLVAPSNSKVKVDIGPDLGIYMASITAWLGSLRRPGPSLLGTIADTTTAFVTDGAAVSAQ